MTADQQTANPIVPEVLAEIDAGGTIRQLLKGDEPFDSGTPAGRVFARAPGSEPSDYEYDGQPDSTAELRIPSREIDDDELHDASVWCVSGPAPIVVIADTHKLPRDVLAALARTSARAMAPEPGKDFDDVVNIAEGIKNLAIWILNERIRLIEQTVRDALSDDHLTDDDYTALRKYPERLATVERLALSIRNPEPTWEKLRPPPRDMVGMISPAADLGVLDMFYKWASETEADAKAAVGRISGLVATQQVAMGLRQRLEVERLQRTVTIVGAAVLVPGMIAAVFGANLDIPGEGTRSGFWGMLLLMAAGGLGSYTGLRLVERGSDLKAGIRETATAVALVAMVAVAILLLCA